MEKVFTGKELVHKSVKRIRCYLIIVNNEECSFSDKIHYYKLSDSLADSLFVLDILSVDKYTLLRRIIDENIKF